MVRRSDWWDLWQVWRDDHDEEIRTQLDRHPSEAVAYGVSFLGSGVCAQCLGARLRAAGIEDYTILERTGTWGADGPLAATGRPPRARFRLLRRCKGERCTHR